MQVYWSRGNSDGTCSAVMISDRVGLMAAHCVMSYEMGKIEEDEQHNYRVSFADDVERHIAEVRVDSCWISGGGDGFAGSPWSHDLAMFFLDKPLVNAVKGVDYVELWNPADHNYEDLTGAEFMLAGFGYNGPFEPGEYYYANMSFRPKLHRGYNKIRNI